MWPFTKKQAEKLTTIRYRYLINGEEEPTRYLTAEASKTEANSLHIKENIEDFKLQVQSRLTLDGLPEVTIKEHNPPIISEGNEILITFLFTYNDPPKRKFFSMKALVTSLFIFIFLTAGTVGFFLWKIDSKVIEEEQNNPYCKVQFIEGTPHSIIIGKVEYKLEEDGTMSLQTRAILNPWHQEIMNAGECYRIDLVNEKS